MTEERRVFRGNVLMLSENWKWFLIVGIVLVGLGLLAIMAPMVASFALELTIGWILLFGGILLTVHAFQSRKWGRFFLEFAHGLLYLLFSFYLLARPMSGILTLTAFLAVFFVIEGLMRIFQAVRFRPLSHWGWTLASGTISVLLGGIIWFNLPWTALWAIGLIVGIDLIVGGLSMALLALSARGEVKERYWHCVGDRCFSTR